jgi:hypothetical protein
MNRIKDILKKNPTRDDLSPMNIIYRDNILFEDKTSETMPGKYNEMIENMMRKKMEMNKKPHQRIRILEDEEEQPAKKEKKPSKTKVGVNEEPEPVPEPEQAEPVAETAEEEKDFNDISQIIDFIKRNKQGRIPNVETSYYLTNRKRFIEFVKRIFGKYREELAAITKPASCDTISSDKKLSLLVHQRLITDYLNMYTPYRGLLLFHGLGSGKTCSSIAIAENFKNPNKQVIVMTPASLKPNFIKEIKKCGDFVYRINNNWIWQPYEKLKKHTDRLESEMHLSRGYIKNHNGAWVIDREINGKLVTRKNRAAMNSLARHSLDDQLTTMIEKRYTHISYNGVRMSHLNALTDGFTANPFDNKVVVIDEAHKFISPIVNKLRTMTSKSRKKSEEAPLGIALNLYELLLRAKNARIILLTGTPIVNYPNETAVLYNIIRGYIHAYELKVRVRSSSVITNETLRQMFYRSEIAKQVDYFNYSPSDSLLTITRNPFRFLNTKTERGNYSGVKLDLEDTEGVDMDNDEFIQAVKKELKKLDIDVEKTNEHNYKNLPDSLDSFMTRFYDGSNLINKDQLANRLVGLTSYFSGTPELLPRYKKEENYHEVNVPMSNYQADQYATERSVELHQEENVRKTRRKLKNGEEFDEPTSSYKIFSRLYCNYAFPIEIGRPKPGEDFLDSNEAKSEEKEKEKKGGSHNEDDEYEEVDSDYDYSEDEDAAGEYYAGGAGEEDKPKRKYTRKPKEAKEAKEAKEGEMPPPPAAAEEKPKRKYTRKPKDVKEEKEGEHPPPPAAAEPKEAPPVAAEEKPKRKYVRKTAKEEKEVPRENVEGDENEFKDTEERDADEVLNEDSDYVNRISRALRQLEQNGEEYLSVTGLEKHSPKFLRIIQNIQNPQHQGLHLVYSQFRTMEGIGIFKLALDYNGFAEFKISKDSATGLWTLNIREEDNEKPKYALYTGKETKEVKEIIMNIYNGFFDLVPPELVKVLREMYPNKNNNMGEIIKVFMITASGAEGLDLKNTRYVHLMEPFWNFVRIEQVIGRAVRICSHKNLPEEFRTVEAFIYKGSKKQNAGISKSLAAVMGKDTSRLDGTTPITTDQNLYEISIRKEEAISQLLKTIKETSIDCTVYPSNQIEGLQCYAHPDPTSLEYSYNPNVETDSIAPMKKNI